MNARRRMIKVTPEDCADVLTALHQFGHFSERDVAAVEKDMHLVAAARFSDRSVPPTNRAVLSTDEAVRVLLRRLAPEARALDRLQWANPTQEFEPLRAWLADGEPASPLWRLAVAATTKPPSRRSPRASTRGNPP